ncbi:hypothetical protein [Streptomyces sp. NPDC058674]
MADMPRAFIRGGSVSAIVRIRSVGVRMVQVSFRQTAVGVAIFSSKNSM